MEIDFLDDEIKFEKELSSLDKFVIDFVSLLDNLDIKYVIVSGYVSILFGRNRSSEDIDLIIEKMEFIKFKELWEKIQRDFECLITEDFEIAYNDYINKNYSLRFSRKGEYIPNMEIKFPKNELDLWSLNNSKLVILNNHKMFISQIELQIPFKLFLGSEKDIEDAKYLYSLFKDKLNMELLNEFNRKLKIVDLFNKYIK